MLRARQLQQMQHQQARLLTSRCLQQLLQLTSAQLGARRLCRSRQALCSTGQQVCPLRACRLEATYMLCLSSI